MCELIRAGAQISLNSGQDWLDEVDRTMLAANQAVAADPALARLISRNNRAGLIHVATSHLRDPSAPVPPSLGAETLRLARDLARRGLEGMVLDTYRAGQSAAVQQLHDIAFALTSDPQELRELLDRQFRSANDFVAASLAGIASQLRSEYQELTRDIRAERREVVELILKGAPISPARAEARLGYPLDRSHTAAVIWCDELDADPSQLDRAADAFGHAVECLRPLTVAAGSVTRWVWVKDVTAFDIDQIQKVLDGTPDTRIAIGTTARGIDGFRRSHLDALSTQRMMVRLQSHQRAAFYGDVQMVALLSQNPDGADDFITSTLGNFASANPELQATVLTFIKQQCNAARAAKLLYTHRNTLLRRLDTAERLLPRPLDHTTVEVAVAIQALQWRGKQSSGSTEIRTS